MTIYRERGNGRWEYWTYCDRRRVYLHETTVMLELERGAKLVRVG